MVSLAIAETSYSHLKDRADEPESLRAKSLRDSALWFPQIPASHLQLNETCFTGLDFPTFEFQPIFYILFGSSGVTNFQSLRKISVFFQHDCLMAIDFHYDTGNIQRLGSRSQQLSAYEILYFLIDSAQGEAIQTIEVDLCPCISNPENTASSWKHERLRSFKVSILVPLNLALLIQAIIS